MTTITHTPDTKSQSVIDIFHNRFISGKNAIVIKDGTIRNISLNDKVYFSANALWVSRNGNEFKLIQIGCCNTGKLLYQRDFSEFGERYFV